MKFNVRTLETVESTQDLIREEGEMATGEGLVIHALEQTSGKGRMGKTWESPRGNLYMSVLLRPECLAEDAGQIAFVSALAVSAALETYLPAGHEKTLKWPNDILIDGKKIAGILCETSLVRGRVDHIALGVGINVSAPPEDPGATGLDAINARENSIEGLRDNVLESFDRHYKVWLDKGFERIKAAWLKQAHGVDCPVTVILPDAEIQGVFKGMDENGAMIMEDKSGNERHIKSAQVIFKD